MEGNFSRITFKASKQYNRVLMQQGRVQLDADWNDMMDEITYAHQSAIRNLFGENGVPFNHAGFRTFAQNSLNFNGKSDYIDLGPRFSLSNGNFLIETLVCPRWGGSGGTILSKFKTEARENYRGEYRLLIKYNGTLIFQRLERTAETRESSATTEQKTDRPPQFFLRTLEVPEAIEFGQFVRIAIVSYGTALLLFIDDRLVAGEIDLEPGVEARDIPFAIGAQFANNYPTHFFDGFISEIHLAEVLNPRELEQQALQLELSRLQKRSLWSLLQNRDNLLSEWEGDSPEQKSAPRAIAPPIFLSQGVAYAAGILCYNETDIPLYEQPDLPPTALPPIETLSGSYLLYLDVWLRYISDINDPSIREVALGGASTTGRSKIVWQVKLLPLDRGDAKVQWVEKFKHLLESHGDRGWLKARHHPHIHLAGNYLYRFEIHNPGFICGTPPSSQVTAPILKVKAIAATCVEVLEGELDFWEIGQWVEIAIEVSGQTLEELVKIVELDLDRNRVVFEEIDLAIAIGQTYSLRPIATLKWSRENGSIAYAIERIKDEVVTITTLHQGPPALQIGDWLEIADDAYILADRIQHLYQIQSIDPAIDAPTFNLTLNPPPLPHVGCDRSQHPFVRRWDQKTANWQQEAESGQTIPKQIELRDGVIPLQKGWLDIENGIQIQFEAEGFYQKRNYWWTPARQITQNIEWPLNENSQPEFRPPHGIKHHYMPLSLVDFKNQHSVEIIDDLRNIVSTPGDWLSKGGGTITGNLAVEGDVEVEGEMLVRRNVTVGRLYGQLAADIVDTPQIVMGAITPEKLAADIGYIPPHYYLLGSTPLPPSGYQETGLYLNIPVSIKARAWQTSKTLMPKGGRVYVAVIRDSIYCLWDTGELWAYQPNNPDRSWSEKTRMPAPERKAFDVGVLQGKLYAIGGYLTEEPHAGEKTGLNYEYDPDRDRWYTDRAKMPTPRSHLGIGVVGDKLYAIGGQTSCLWGLLPNVTTGANEAYDPISNRWSRENPLPRARSAFGIGEDGGALYLFGGQHKWFFGIWGKQKVPWSDAFAPLGEQWYKQTPLPNAISHMGVGVIDGQFHIIGGTTSRHPQDTNLVYDPRTRVWQQAASLAIARKSFGTAVVDGAIYVLGGITPNGLTSSIEKAIVNSVFYIHQKQP